MLTACGIETGKLPVGKAAKLLVATVLTACGIETAMMITITVAVICLLQQCLPLAVLKLTLNYFETEPTILVATVLTACGIETSKRKHEKADMMQVATVLTACGIETLRGLGPIGEDTELQQCLPLAVLKH